MPTHQPDPEKFLEHAEGRADETRDGATVIRCHFGRLDLQVFTTALEQAAQLCPDDATRLCFLSPGILADNVDPAVAQALAAALEAQGEPCLVVPAADLLPLPPVELVCHAQLTQEAFHPVVEPQTAPEEAPWSSAFALTLANVHDEETKTVPEPMVGMLGHALSSNVFGLMWGEPLLKWDMQTRVESLGACLDLLFQNPLRRYRIDAGRFDFSLLGKEAHLTAEANIHDLARWFLYAAPQMHTNVDAKRLMDTGQAPLLQLTPPQYEDLAHWLLNLAHFSSKPAGG